MTYRKCAAILAAGAVALAIANLSVAASSTAAETVKKEPGQSELVRNLVWQIALEKTGLSPGLLDGKFGSKTRLALRDYQRVNGLPQTGECDAATAAALKLTSLEPGGEAVIAYTVTDDDLKEVGDLPKGWLEKSRLTRLPYPSLEEALAEKFHTSRAALVRLNPGLTPADLKPGAKLLVPRVSEPAKAVKADRIDVDLGEKAIRLSSGGRLVALFHCSVAADKAKLPAGQATVRVIAPHPTYVFDPEMWKNVKGIDHKLLIPPGPRNPVGLCWVGLSLPGYGMHGTPSPEMIGKTGSHGCFRLTNWDAVRLGQMVEVGTPVYFKSSAAEKEKSLASVAANRK
jgi:lipoprotein-anchoring transpeptidase ErfK/SrfK